LGTKKLGVESKTLGDVYLPRGLGKKQLWRTGGRWGERVQKDEKKRLQQRKECRKTARQGGLFNGVLRVEGD